MNLLERQRMWSESPVRRVQQLPSDLYCGSAGEDCVCLMQQCAYYDPNHDECIHVLAAKAQMGMAESLAQMVQDGKPQSVTVSIDGAEKIAKQIREQVGMASEQTRPEPMDITDAARALKRGHRIRRVAWAAGKVVWHSVDTRRVACRHGHDSQAVLWAPTIEDLLAEDYVVMEEAETR